MKKWKIVIDGKAYESDCDDVEDAISEVAEGIVEDNNYSDLAWSAKLRSTVGEEFKKEGIAYSMTGEEFKFSCRVDVHIEADIDVNNLEVEEITDPEVVEQRRLEAAGNHPDLIQLDLGGV